MPGRYSIQTLPFTGNEKLLQYVWQFQYFNNEQLTTTDGEALTILSPGMLNTNQGPDFINARIRIGNTVLAGNVEIHVCTSHWKQHGHDSDERYQNIILHVVYQNDASSTAPVLELRQRIPHLLLERYEALMNTVAFIPCGHAASTVKEITWTAWKERLLAERLSEKALLVNAILESTQYHWEEAFWRMLARAFGMKVNSDAFESIAASLPVSVLAKHKNNIHQLEALLLGQAGLLKDDFSESYPQMLQKEYAFLQKKYKLQQVLQPVQFLRMRPQNFPTLRLAQLAALIQRSTHLFSMLLEAKDLQEVVALFDVCANDYWHTHYRFDEASAFKEKKLGMQAIHHILINTVAPVLFAYAGYHKNEALKAKLLQWLEALPPEQNNITKGFEGIGVRNGSAFDSQALIQLKNFYCSERRCLQCAVGNAILKS